MVVGALVICWENAGEVLPEKETSPEYSAVTACVPACRPATASDACRSPPTAATGAEPRTVLPSLNVTVPVGDPVLAAMVAVKVTVSPYTAGLPEEAIPVTVGTLPTVWLVVAEDPLKLKFPT